MEIRIDYEREKKIMAKLMHAPSKAIKSTI